MIGDRQRITVAAVAQLELALEVDTPQIIGYGALRQRRAARAMARPAAALDQAVTIEDRMDGALAGTLISPSSRRTSSSRILRAPQCGLSAFSRTIRLSTCCGSWLA